MLIRLALAALALTAAPALAQDGRLDTSFGTDGVATFDLSRFGERVIDVGNLDRQRSGRTLVPVCLQKGSEQRGVLVGIAIDGTLDATFADDGALVLPNGTCPAHVSALPDGRFALVVGRLGYSSFSNGVFRVLDAEVHVLETDGELDASFGTEGRADLPDGFSPQLLAVDDGALIVAGRVGTSSQYGDVAVARLRADGSTDTDFGEGGIGVADLYAGPADIAIDAQHRIVVIDEVVDPGGGLDPGSKAFLARFLPDGRLDTSFGADGVSVIYRSANDRFVSVVVPMDGAPVAAGAIANDGMAGSAPTTVRLRSDGAVDPTYGQNGVSTFREGGMHDDIALSDTNEIYVTRSRGRLVVSRLTRSGAVDEGFGDGGSVPIPHTTSVNRSAMLSAPDRTITVAGWYTIVRDAPPFLTLARLAVGAPVADEPEPAPTVGMRVTPNPSAGRFEISLTLPTPGDVGVEVFDVLGRRVTSEAHRMPGGAGTVRLSLTGRPAGVYWVRVSADGLTEARRVTVAR